MKILVISDTHGNLRNIEHVVEFAKRLKIETLIHCGDWDNLPAVEMVMKSQMYVYAVLGNADAPHREEILDMLKEGGANINTDILRMELSERRIVVAHFPRLITQQIAEGKFDVAFYGHTHRRKKEIYLGTLMVNPGSLQSPNSSFAIYDTLGNQVEFLNVGA